MSAAVSRGVPFRELGTTQASWPALGICAVGVILVGFAPPFGFLLGALVLVGCAVSAPWVSVPLVLTTLPFSLHPRSIAGFEVSTTEIAIITTSCALLVREGWRRIPWPLASASSASALPLESATTGSIRAARPPLIDWFVAALIGSALISLTVTEYPRQSLRELRWLVVEPVLVLSLARATLRSPEHVRLTLWSFVATGALAGVVALTAMAAAGDLTTASSRAMAPYLSPNQLGMFLSRAGAVAAAIVLFAGPNNRTERRLSLAALAPIGAALARSLSLGAWIGFGVALVLEAALRGRRTAALVIAGLALIGALAVALAPRDRISERWDPASGTALSRVQIWTAAARMIADHPILGVGMDNFLYAYRGGYMLPESWREPNISHPHNWIMDFWLQLGIPGLAAFAASMGWTISAALRIARAGAASIDRQLGAAALGTTAILLTHGFVDNSYFLVDLATLWWVMIGLLIVRDADRRAGQLSAP
ncbi:MAG TPA: O-antigen ligase family protein [Chloroflexota bacterium]|nr:O-antigen ligase family protein [Chloroflexota bacterium]